MSSGSTLANTIKGANRTVVAIEPKQLVHFGRETRGLSCQHGLDIVRRIDVGSAAIKRHLKIWLAAVTDG